MPGVHRSGPVSVFMHTFFWLLALLPLLAACDRPRNPFGPDVLFVAAIAGQGVREKPAATGRIRDVLPLNEKLTVMERQEEQKEEGGRPGHWVRVQYGPEGSGEGWVFDASLSADPVERYFRVQAVAGLPLREKPDLRAKSLTQLPYFSIARIETASRRLDFVEGRSGYWLRTTWENATGWLFSGFVVVSDHRRELEKEGVLDLADRRLEESDQPLKQLLAGARTTDVIETDDFNVHTALFPSHDIEACDHPESRLIFERRRDGALFVTGNASARLLKQDYPLPGAFLLSTKVCSCCSAREVNQVIFPDRAAPVVIHFFPESLEARCAYDRVTGEQSVLRAENRVDPDSGDLFLYWQQPLCRLPPGLTPERAAAQGFSIPSVQEYRHDVFARLRFTEGRLRIDRYQDRHIPPSLREAWERSDSI